ncbi:MAG: NPCBM/NEW2 domain-containing protein [Verrucomicrobiae bacterium]|nr:NPCBM/NEW2 domain-containing protein [Verrucomicrobiae bacterium]
MKRIHVYWITIVSVLGGTPSMPAATDAVVASLQARIDAYHKDAEESEHPLRLVYFHPNDAGPQKNYKERITRIMLDAQSFIRGEMKRNGFHERSIRLEMEGELVKLHRVEGREGAGGYDYDFRYGQKILREMTSALKGVINFDREYVLVFCGLCPKTDDGVYHFRSPYYGWGDSGVRRGLCFAADCELLDTAHFTNTTERIRYTEHLGSFDKTLAAFNSLYLGGIVHELGHGLGLPHNREKPWEFRDHGRALMGSGNFTYRTELTGGKGSFLTRASALRLATHPMFTGSDRGRFDRADIGEPVFEFENTPDGLRVRGRVSGNPEVFAVIAYSDPEGGSNYDAHTWIAPVEDGRFELNVRVHRDGPNELRFQFCHLNGRHSTRRFPYVVEKGRPDVDGLKDSLAYSLAEEKFMKGDKREASKIAREELDRAGRGPRGIFAEKLAHLIELAGARTLESLASTKADSVALSHVEWKSASVGWGKPVRDQYYSGNGVADGVCVELGGGFHPAALYAHSPARHVYDLGGNWKRLSAVGGLHAGGQSNGSGVFIVRGDGRELFRSDMLKGPALARVEVDVNGVRTLELLVESGKGDNHGCWTVWGSPTLHR